MSNEFQNEPEFGKLSKYDLGGSKLSSIQAKPCLQVSYQDGRYHAVLGANEMQSGNVVFVETNSKHHDWIQSRKSIKPMPNGFHEDLNKCFEGVSLDDLPYPKVLAMSKNPEDYPFTLEFSDNVFTSAALQAEQVSATDIPSTVNATLYPYQIQGVNWMWQVMKKVGGVILADEMGLGKTLQVITLICKIPRTENRPVIIACPSSLLINWYREISKFAPSLNCVIHQGSNRARIYSELQKPDVVITTYDTLNNDRIVLDDIEWSMLVCDEAQALKNPDSTKRKHISALPRKYTVMMTGTPIENSLLDLWSIADMAIPGCMSSKDDFLATYPDNPFGADKLKEQAEPIVLKRLVKDVAKDLPERSNIEIQLEMSPELSEEYERIKSEIKEHYGRAGDLVATGQMVIFSAHPWLQAKDPENPWEGEVVINTSSTMPLMTPKMEALMTLLKDAFYNNKKVLVFAAFNKCRELIEMAAKEAGLPNAFWGQINGSTPAFDRQPIIDEFSDYEGPGVLILNPRAAGAGLNITSATVVIHFTQYWNPAIEAQASKRAHRNGQKEHVSVYYLIYKGSVEEDMLAKVEWKTQLAESAITPQTIS